MHTKIKANKEPPQLMERTLNNTSTGTEPPPLNGHQPKPPGVKGSLNAF